MDMLNQIPRVVDGSVTVYSVQSTMYPRSHWKDPREKCGMGPRIKPAWRPMDDDITRKCSHAPPMKK